MSEPGADFTIKVLRRFGLWLIICTISAAPSFVWAQAEFSREAMIVGVAIFVLLYTVGTCTPQFERFHDLPHVRPTLYTGYIVRVLLSIAFPIGMGIDLFPGLLSVQIVESLGIKPQQFRGTLLTTVVQGTLLNIILAIFMLAMYPIIRLISLRRQQKRRPGFEVIMPLPVNPIVQEESK